jgi:hypothetical protein
MAPARGECHIFVTILMTAPDLRRRGNASVPPPNAPATPAVSIKPVRPRVLRDIGD